jgi:hypothetical protein
MKGKQFLVPIKGKQFMVIMKVRSSGSNEG